MVLTNLSALASFQWCFSKGFVRKTLALGYPPGGSYFGEQRSLLCVETHACLFHGTGALDQGSSAPETSSSSCAFSGCCSFIPCAGFHFSPWVQETWAALRKDSLHVPFLGKSMRFGRNHCFHLQTRGILDKQVSVWHIFFRRDESQITVCSQKLLLTQGAYPTFQKVIQSQVRPP